MSEFDRLTSFFSEPAYAALENKPAILSSKLADSAGFARWYERNTFEHKKIGLSHRNADAQKTRTSTRWCNVQKQMQKAADLSDKFSFGELRVSHEQNSCYFADVRQEQLVELWEAAKEAGFATPTLGFTNRYDLLFQVAIFAH